MDAERFNQGMQVLSAVLDGDAISPERVAVRYQAYRVVLDDVDGGDFLEACQRAVNTLKWFPKPVELRECVEAVTREREALARAGEYAERIRRSDEALERERAERYGRWDPVRKVLVKADGTATETPPLPLPDEGGVGGRIIVLAEHLATKGRALGGVLALPPPLSPEAWEARRREALEQLQAAGAARAVGEDG